MLSRLAFRNAQLVPAAIRGVQNVTSSTSAVASERPKRLIDPSPVRHGFIPDEWFTFFYPKTGVTGPYAFLTAFGTYLVSKEVYILEHEFYNGISFLIIWIYATKKFGPKLAAYLDKQVDNYETELESERTNAKDQLVKTIKDLETEKWRVEAQKMLFDIRKQNVLMQLEATYRERLIQVHNEVKKRLDYHLAIDNMERRLSQKHMCQWIINNVLKAITPDQEKATLQQCIKDLEVLAAHKA